MMNYESPFLESLDNGPQKLSPKALSRVLKVVRSHNSRSSPSGCARNPNAQTSNIDDILEENKKHILKTPVKISRPAPKLPNISLPPAKLKTPTHRAATSLPVSYQSPRSVATDESFPVHFKSTPLHMDPRYIFKKRARNLSLNLSMERNRRLENVVNSCPKPGSVMHKKKIDRVIESVKGISKDAQVWVDDLSSVMQISSNKKIVEILLNKKQYDHLIDKRLYDISQKQLRDDLLTITLKLGPSKIWKQDHKTFMAAVDSAISSIAVNRS